MFNLRGAVNKHKKLLGTKIAYVSALGKGAGTERRVGRVNFVTEHCIWVENLKDQNINCGNYRESFTHFDFASSFKSKL